MLTHFLGSVRQSLPVQHYILEQTCSKKSAVLHSLPSLAYCGDCMLTTSPCEMHQVLQSALYGGVLSLLRSPGLMKTQSTMVLFKWNNFLFQFFHSFAQVGKLLLTSEFSNFTFEWGWYLFIECIFHDINHQV